MSMTRILSVLASAIVLTLLIGPTVSRFPQASCATGLQGWQVLSDDDYIKGKPYFLDGVTFQWDYFMVHDDGFTGSIGYVVADPRQHLAGLMPSGGNVAISGTFPATGEIADYVNFGVGTWTGPGAQGYVASADIREFHGEKGVYYGHIIPVADNETLILKGRTERFEWELAVSQDWPERCYAAYEQAFSTVTGYDAGNFAYIPLQHWSVDMTWLRTRVRGYIRNLVTGMTVPIDGHGYREQAWGPWAFNFSGWDFAVVSDNATKVQWALQSYHDSAVMDYLDVSFYDGGNLKAVRFTGAAGELGWYHTAWHYDQQARQCMPRDMTVIARNSQYTVEAFVDIGDNQVPMLSDLTPITSQYVIMCRFPVITGTIKRIGSGEPVASFAGQGGGEFSIARRPSGDDSQSAESCAVWGGRFTMPPPFGCVDNDNDGYGYAGGPGCAHPERDCDDTNPSVHPGSREQMGNKIDDNCDGKIDGKVEKLWQKLFRMIFLYAFLQYIF